MRLRDRGEVGVQIADLSRGVGDLARQVGEFGRRLAAVEAKLDARDIAHRDDAHAREIAELGALVKRLAMQVATHDEVLAGQLRGRRDRRADSQRCSPRHPQQPRQKSPRLPSPQSLPSIRRSSRP